MRLQELLRVAAVSGNTTALRTLLRRPERAQLVDAGNEVRYRRQPMRFQAPLPSGDFLFGSGSRCRNYEAFST